MKLDLEPGKYVVAVSGGVDSVVLLHLLISQFDPQKYEFVVAHYDHGIRRESVQDRKLVQDLAAEHGLDFFHSEGALGPTVSEEFARKKRYEFLREIKNEVGARAIITAHHQDDLLETMIFNLLRGTNRKGLTSLGSTKEIKRPLIDFPKQKIIRYAQQHKLSWHEDSTNQDLKYSRNFIRHHILPKFSPGQREELIKIHEVAKEVNKEIGDQTSKLFDLNALEINRAYFTRLPHIVAVDFLAVWLRQKGVSDLTSKTLDILATKLKTLKPGKTVDIDKNYKLEIRQDSLVVASRK